jgi:hypothetical protein
MLGLSRRLLAPAAAAASAAAAAPAAAACFGTTNPNPPPDAARGATADLCDVFHKDPVDVLPAQPTVQIAAPVFR